MRRRVDAERVESLMRALGESARAPARVYFTGGVSAVLLGWRTSTLDVDYRVEPDDQEIFPGIPALKERLELNLEPASPQDFIPELVAWRDRSRFIGRRGEVAFFHYDFYAQALAKIERGHAQDVADVREMVRRGLVELSALSARFDEVEAALAIDRRYSAIDAPSFRRALEELVDGFGKEGSS